MEMIDMTKKFFKSKSKGEKGFIFEDAIVDRLGLTPESEHTHKWDAYTPNGDDIAIKNFNIKNEMIFDLFRQTKFDKDKFFLIVGIYSERDSLNIDNVYLSTIDTKKWVGMLNLEIVEELRKYERYVKNKIKNETMLKKDWDEARNEFYKKWEKTTPNIIRLRLRAYTDDTKTYVTKIRIQCAIRYTPFKRYFIEGQEFKTKRFMTGPKANLLIPNFLNKYPEIANELNINKDNAEKKRVSKEENKRLKFEEAKRKRNEELDKIAIRQSKELIVRTIYQNNKHLFGHTLESIMNLSQFEIYDILKSGDKSKYAWPTKKV